MDKVSKCQKVSNSKVLTGVLRMISEAVWMVGPSLLFSVRSTTIVLHSQASLRMDGSNIWALYFIREYCNKLLEKSLPTYCVNGRKKSNQQLIPGAAATHLSVNQFTIFFFALCFDHLICLLLKRAVRNKNYRYIFAVLRCSIILLRCSSGMSWKGTSSSWFLTKSSTIGSSSSKICPW